MKKVYSIQLAFIQRSMEYSRAASHLWNDKMLGGKRKKSRMIQNVNGIYHHKFQGKMGREIVKLQQWLTVFCLSLNLCENNNFCISARVVPAQKRAFYRLLRTVGRDILASTPCLFVEANIESEKHQGE
jgi:hypothetical protein